jgi:hypothetical protein
MAEKRREDTGFKVTDRRLFNSEGELRNDVPEEAEPAKPAPAAAAPAGSDGKAAQLPPEAPNNVSEIPPPPTATEQAIQAEAYRKSSKELDSQVEISGHSAKEFEMTFERFLASLYMTAMLQLGLMREQGAQPRIDIIGARQTIDTLSLISEKTKGNLTSTEENFLQNSLYELRMAYVEVTNALAQPPQAGPGAGSGTGTIGR